MIKEKKSELTGEMTQLLNSTDALYFIGFSHMTVAEVNALRTEFQKSGIRYKVVKNTKSCENTCVFS